ncbi:MAG: glycosyltransferase [Gemmataceae bacterium]|nr:glycosyltransferase [Gemmataceae bacterium]
MIIPTFNRSGYVRDCLVALRESGVPDLDIIVADDGSTDDTREVVEATEPSARYLWQPNSGTPATARNKGFDLARGRYVGFLDCDDAWLPGAPARAVGFLDRHPEVDVLFAEARMGNPQEGYVSWIASAGQDDFHHLPGCEAEPGFRLLERGPFFRRMAVRNPVFIGACIMRREAFEKVGRFEPTLCGAADWELWLRLASYRTFGYMAEPLALYARHSDNMSSNFDKMIGEFCQALRNVLSKCDLSPEDRAFIKQRLRHHLFNHAYLSYDEGRLAEARRRFGCYLREGGTWTALVYWLACCLPGGLLRWLRRSRKPVGGGLPS